MSRADPAAPLRPPRLHSFPAGLWAASVEELHADRSCPLSLHPSSDAALAALPPLPRLKALRCTPRTRAAKSMR